MIPNNFLRVTLWLVCLFSLLTNLLVIAGRVSSKIPAMRNMFTSTINGKQNGFLINLAIADLLTGVYLLIIGISDAVFGKTYFLSALKWREGIWCKGIGFVGFLANIASILTLTFVSIERFFAIVMPFSRVRFRSKLTTTVCVTIWVISGVMAFTPIILSKFVEEIFGFSDICLALPIVSVLELSKYSDVSVSAWGDFGEELELVYHDTEVSRVQWLYSQIVYVYFSSTCVLLIALCYISILKSTIASRQTSGRSADSTNEVNLALKVSLIIGTDLLCWLPVIITGILSQTGTNISTDTYAWFAIFVMPINSAVNPFIYTIHTMMSKKKNEP
ncbi:hypothetical protein HOLleu_10058 [Holothuria leucospilota]|uniref:G-protein coupled receptors family 1 profile domain-containing protein n=1 Tax=Holothuria leucospilota TaxID=206669 RepID=A0A9Q1CE81_HOLLE|nr:hypothetical protein HOLleu_10058 [Holothuria leucospilota]